MYTGIYMKYQSPCTFCFLISLSLSLFLSLFVSPTLCCALPCAFPVYPPHPLPPANQDALLGVGVSVGVFPTLGSLRSGRWRNCEATCHQWERILWPPGRSTITYYSYFRFDFCSTHSCLLTDFTQYTSFSRSTPSSLVI